MKAPIFLLAASISAFFFLTSFKILSNSPPCPCCSSILMELAFSSSNAPMTGVDITSRSKIKGVYHTGHPPTPPPLTPPHSIFPLLNLLMQLKQRPTKSAFRTKILFSGKDLNMITRAWESPASFAASPFNKVPSTAPLTLLPFA